MGNLVEMITRELPFKSTAMKSFSFGIFVNFSQFKHVKYPINVLKCSQHEFHCMDQTAEENKSEAASLTYRHSLIIYKLKWLR